MRIRTGAAALVLALLLAGHATAQSSGTTGSSSPFNFSLSKIFGWVSSATSSATSSTSSTSPPVARPQVLAPRNTSLSSYLPSLKLPTPQRTIGYSIYPTEDQMPGADYLKAFGLKVAPRVPIQ
jgi:hypothetical protein